MNHETSSDLQAAAIAAGIGMASLQPGCAQLLGADGDHVVDCGFVSKPADPIAANDADETKQACATTVADYSADGECDPEEVEAALKITCKTPSATVHTTCAAIRNKATLKELFADPKTTCTVGGETN